MFSLGSSSGSSGSVRIYRRIIFGKLRLIRKVEGLERIFPTLGLSIEEKAARWYWKNPRSINTQHALYFIMNQESES